jgi:hypothetical protein
MKRQRLLRLLLLCMLIIPQAATALGTGEQSSGCSWNGPSPEWVLARHLPVGKVTGSLSADVIPFMRHSGVPISFIINEASGASIQLKIDAKTTTRDVLEEIVRQLPGYRYAVVSKSVVVYPREQEYDAPVELSALRGVTRTRALLSLIRELRVRVSSLKILDLPTLKGAGHRTLYGDTVEVGGSRTVVEHLVSLIQKRPSIVFSVLPEQDGHLGFGFFSVPLVQKVIVETPSTVTLGETFQAITKAILSDGSVVPLEGPECYVEYEASGHGELEIDDVGHIVAIKKGISGVAIRYENKSDLVKVEVH